MITVHVEFVCPASVSELSSRVLSQEFAAGCCRSVKKQEESAA